MEKITFENNYGDIVIRIPGDLIKFAAENNPETPMIVKNKTELAEHIIWRIEFNLGPNESGITGLQELLDKAIITTLEAGEDCIEEK